MVTCSRLMNVKMSEPDYRLASGLALTTLLGTLYWTKCLAQKSPSLTQTQIREVIKSLPSSERDPATKAIRKGTAN